MVTEKSCITDVVDTTLEPGKHSRYEFAETIVSTTTFNTSATSSTVFAVSTSTMHGSVSIRMIPIPLQRSVDDELTT